MSIATRPIFRIQGEPTERTIERKVRLANEFLAAAVKSHDAGDFSMWAANIRCAVQYVEDATFLKAGCSEVPV